MTSSRNSIFICFTGIDGSGKSTLAGKTVRLLGSLGLDARYVYARYQPVLTWPFVFLGRPLLLHGKNQFVDYYGYKTARKKLFKNDYFSRLYEKMILGDFYFQMLYKIILPLKMGKSIVCDRYIFDTVITDLATDLYTRPETAQFRIDALLQRFPAPDLILFVDVPEEVAMQRKNDIPSAAYLKERRRLYSDLSGRYRMIYLNGCNSIDELEAEIRERVLQCLQRSDCSR